MGDWLSHFDVDFYRNHQHTEEGADLAALDNERLYEHFTQVGWREGRAYSRFIHSFLDADFYLKEYPELDLKTPGDAHRHWNYEGFYENRFPNETTKLVAGSRFHLFQFGKVGSHSVMDALRSAGHSELIMHLHWPTDLMSVYPDCIFSYEKVINRTQGRTVNFITGVRDPFERMISGYFQTHLSQGRVDASPEHIARIRDDVSRVYFDRGDVRAVLGWFDHGFFRNVDVYAYDFDASAGYTVIEAAGLRIFLYRLDKLSQLGRQLSDFVGLELNLRVVNAARDKAYSGLHRQVMERLKFSAEDVKAVLSSQFTSHFFTEPEVRRMADRWGRAS